MYDMIISNTIQLKPVLYLRALVESDMVFA